MRRRRFSEDQIVRILEEFEEGKSVEELCREYNVARSTIYMWRKKYGGIDKPMLKKLKELQKENARLKKIVVQQALDIDNLKDLLGKDW
jgi:putative transposase